MYVKVKGRDIYILRLEGSPDQQRFTMRSGVLTGNDTGGTVQVAAAHCPNERTLDPAVCSQTDPTMPQSAVLWLM